MRAPCTAISDTPYCGSAGLKVLRCSALLMEADLSETLSRNNESTSNIKEMQYLLVYMVFTQRFHEW